MYCTSMYCTLHAKAVLHRLKFKWRIFCSTHIVQIQLSYDFYLMYSEFFFLNLIYFSHAGAQWFTTLFAPNWNISVQPFLLTTSSVTVILSQPSTAHPDTEGKLFNRRERRRRNLMWESELASRWKPSPMGHILNLILVFVPKLHTKNHSCFMQKLTPWLLVQHH